MSKACAVALVLPKRLEPACPQAAARGRAGSMSRKRDTFATMLETFPMHKASSKCRPELGVRGRDLVR